MNDSDAHENGLTLVPFEQMTPEDEENLDPLLVVAIKRLHELELENAALKKSTAPSKRRVAPTIKIGSSSRCNVHPSALDIRVEKHEDGFDVAWIPVPLGEQPHTQTRTSHAGRSFTVNILGTTTVEQSYASHQCHAADGTPLSLSLRAYAQVSVNDRLSPVEAASVLSGDSPQSSDPRDHDDMDPSSIDTGPFRRLDLSSVRDAADPVFIPSHAATESTEQRPQDTPSAPFDPDGNARRP